MSSLSRKSHVELQRPPHQQPGQFDSLHSSSSMSLDDLGLPRQSNSPRILQTPPMPPHKQQQEQHSGAVEIASNHRARSGLKCPICSKVFSNSSAIAKHKLTHSDERKYTCPTCSKAFKRQDHLNGHKLTHVSKKPHGCQLCEKSYSDARSLKRHYENAHPDEYTYWCMTQAAESGEYDSSVAATMAKVSHQMSRGGGNFHQQTTDSISLAQQLTNVLGGSESVGSLRNESSASPYLPGLCGSGRTSPSTLPKCCKPFLDMPLEEPKRVACNICPRRFKNQSALNGHMRLHGGYKLYVSPPPTSTQSSPTSTTVSSGHHRAPSSSIVFTSSAKSVSGDANASTISKAVEDPLPMLDDFGLKNLHINTSTPKRESPRATFDWAPLSNQLDKGPSPQMPGLGRSEKPVIDALLSCASPRFSPSPTSTASNRHSFRGLGPKSSTSVCEVQSFVPLSQPSLTPVKWPAKASIPSTEGGESVNILGSFDRVRLILKDVPCSSSSAYSFSAAENSKSHLEMNYLPAASMRQGGHNFASPGDTGLPSHRSLLHTTHQDSQLSYHPSANLTRKRSHPGSSQPHQLQPRLHEQQQQRQQKISQSCFPDLVSASFISSGGQDFRFQYQQQHQQGIYLPPAVSSDLSVLESEQQQKRYREQQHQQSQQRQSQLLLQRQQDRFDEENHYSIFTSAPLASATITSGTKTCPDHLASINIALSQKYPITFPHQSNSQMFSRMPQQSSQYSPITPASATYNSSVVVADSSTGDGSHFMFPPSDALTMSSSSPVGNLDHPASVSGSTGGEEKITFQRQSQRPLRFPLPLPGQEPPEAFVYEAPDDSLQRETPKGESYRQNEKNEHSNQWVADYPTSNPVDTNQSFIHQQQRQLRPAPLYTPHRVSLQHPASPAKNAPQGLYVNTNSNMVSTELKTEAACPSEMSQNCLLENSPAFDQNPADFGGRRSCSYRSLCSDTYSFSSSRQALTPQACKTHAYSYSSVSPHAAYSVPATMASSRQHFFPSDHHDNQPFEIDFPGEHHHHHPVSQPPICPPQQPSTICQRDVLKLDTVPMARHGLHPSAKDMPQPISMPTGLSNADESGLFRNPQPPPVKKSMPKPAPIVIPCGTRFNSSRLRSPRFYNPISRLSSESLDPPPYTPPPMLSPNRRGSGLFSSVYRQIPLRNRSSTVNQANNTYLSHQTSMILNPLNSQASMGDFSFAPKSAPVTVKQSYFPDHFPSDPLAPKSPLSAKLESTAYELIKTGDPNDGDACTGAAGQESSLPLHLNHEADAMRRQYCKEDFDPSPPPLHAASIDQSEADGGIVPTSIPLAVKRKAFFNGDDEEDEVDIVSHNSHWPCSTPDTEEARSLSEEDMVEEEGLPCNPVPKINVGPAYQACVPEFPIRFDDSRVREKLLWNSKNILDDDPKAEDSLALLKKLARSSAVRNCGLNMEYMFHLLFEFKGDPEKTLRALLEESFGVLDYIYPETAYWSMDEIKHFQDRVYHYEKDFHKVAKDMQALGMQKTVKACVEFYYVWKRLNSPRDIKKIRQRTKRSHAATRSDQQMVNNDYLLDESSIGTRGLNGSAVFDPLDDVGSGTADHSPQQQPPPNAYNLRRKPPSSFFNPDILEDFSDSEMNSRDFDRFRALDTVTSEKELGKFVCRQCEKSFDKVKSLNAHMKSHSTRTRITN